MIGWLFGRSGCWKSTRENHLRREPFCQACGTAKDLEVHHCVPVHLDKTRECDPANLITLCGGKRNCHWAVGHGYDWQAYRPDVRELANTMRLSKVVKD